MGFGTVNESYFDESITKYHGISSPGLILLIIINSLIVIIGITGIVALSSMIVMVWNVPDYCSYYFLLSFSGNSLVLYGSLRYNALKLDHVTTIFLENIAASDVVLVS